MHHMMHHVMHHMRHMVVIKELIYLLSRSILGILGSGYV